MTRARGVEPPACRDLARLHPQARERVIRFLQFCVRADLHVIVTETWRSKARQAWLYAQGRSRPGKVVTNARPGSSRHESGRAADVAFTTPNGGATWDGPWDRVGACARDAGLAWGGDWKFKDYCHVEWTGDPPDSHV